MLVFIKILSSKNGDERNIVMNTRKSFPTIQSYVNSLIKVTVFRKTKFYFQSVIFSVEIMIKLAFEVSTYVMERNIVLIGKTNKIVVRMIFILHCCNLSAIFLHKNKENRFLS